MEAGSELHVFQCQLCERYFFGSSVALVHRCQLHGKKLKSKDQSTMNCLNDFNSSIKAVDFPGIQISLGRRLEESEIQKWSKKNLTASRGIDGPENVEIRLDSLGASEIEKLMRNAYQPGASKMGNLERSPSSDIDDNDDTSDDSSESCDNESKVSSTSDAEEDEEMEEVEINGKEESSKRTPRKRGRKRMNPGEVEIKLDSLKASEIETLMKGLFQVQDPAKVPNKNPVEGVPDTDHVRRSGRQAKERFKSNFGDVDYSSEEEVIVKTAKKRGPGRPKRNKDPDFSVPHIGDNKRPKRSRLENAVVVKYETEDLATTNGEEECYYRARYYCKFCRIKFNHNIHYSEHMKEEHGNTDGTFRCDVCGESYATIKILFKHFNICHSEGYTSIDTTNEQEDAEEKARDYCNTCDIQFPDGKEFSKHMSETHVDEEGNIVCQICIVLHADKEPQAFSSTRKFLRHRRSHYNKNNQLVVEKNPKKKGPFECAVCKKVCPYWSGYIQHLHTHSEKKPRKIVIDPSKNHECPICQIRLSNITSFKRHFTKHLETNPFRCKFGNCDKTFGDYYHLTKHFMAVHTRSGKLLKCTECPARYCNAYYYQRHYRESHKNVSCPIPFSTSNPMALLSSTSGTVQSVSASNDDSSRKESQDENLSASGNGNEGAKADLTIVIKEEIDICDMDAENEDDNNSSNAGEVQSEQALVSLQNRALVEDPVVVNMQRDNPEGYKLIADLVRLARSAPKECYKCHKCDWSASSYIFYERHIKSVHNETPKEPKDARVGGPYSSEKDVDPNALTVCCGTCGYLTKTTDELTVHMEKEHFGNRKFPCLKCGIRLTSKSSLTEHDHRVHGKGEKFPCGTCDTVCSSKISLKTHMKRKHGPKENFECTTCGKVMTTRLGLNEHMKRHNGGARSVCQICGQTYANVYVLARHIQMMHTKTLKLVQVKGKSRKLIRAAATAVSEAELEAAERQNAEKLSAISESEHKTEDVDDKSDISIKEEFTSAKIDGQEIIGF